MSGEILSSQLMQCKQAEQQAQKQLQTYTSRIQTIEVQRSEIDRKLKLARIALERCGVLRSSYRNLREHYLAYGHALGVSLGEEANVYAAMERIVGDDSSRISSMESQLVNLITRFEIEFKRLGSLSQQCQQGVLQARKQIDHYQRQATIIVSNMR